jgi:RNA polymerase primary sigma factor
MVRVLDDVDAPRLQEQRLVYIYHPSFDDPSQETAILAAMPGVEVYEAQCRQMKVPAGVPPELAPLYAPLLSKEQEQHLFRKMNFLKHRATQFRDLLWFPGNHNDAGAARAQDLDNPHR